MVIIMVIMFKSIAKVNGLGGVRTIRYRPQQDVTPHLHHSLRSTEAGALNAQAVARSALDLKKSGLCRATIPAAASPGRSAPVHRA